MAYSPAYYQKNRDKFREYIRRHNAKNPEMARDRVRRFAKTPKGRFAIYKGGAKTRGLPFSLTLEEFVKISSSPCHYCGGEGYGVDRRDSAIGYILGNCLPACSVCNMMKQQSSEQDFVLQCAKIATNVWKRAASAAS